MPLFAKHYQMDAFSPLCDVILLRLLSFASPIFPPSACPHHAPLSTLTSVTERTAAAWALQLWRFAQNRGRLHRKFAALADRARTRRLFRAWLQRADARRFGSGK
jgi:hypothetical protein